jgi:hypothetical protein
MKAGWKNDAAMRAYFEIKRAVWRHNCAVTRHREQQTEALDEVAAELMRTVMVEAQRNNTPKH